MAPLFFHSIYQKNSMISEGHRCPSSRDLQVTARLLQSIEPWMAQTPMYSGIQR